MADVDRKALTQPEKVNKIINEACEYFGFNRDDFIRPCGGRSPIWERKRLLIPVLFNYTALGVREVAKELGYKNHNSVTYHRNRLNEELSEEIYGCERTKRIYRDLLTYLNL